MSILYRPYQKTEIAPLIVLRVCFGLLMLITILRFWFYGWVDKFYIEPSFHFKYYGFEWITPIGAYTHFIFLLSLISSIGILLGYKYRFSVLLFFLSFTYIELMDKTTYLNHYYFVSSLAFLLFFLPAGRFFSIDSKLYDSKDAPKVSRWTVDSVKLLIGLVYFYAGLAKLNSDWLINALPLSIWLPAKYDLFLIGPLFTKQWVHYLFSWGGTLYDLMIPFLLLYSRTRYFAFFVVIVFHVMTRILFPIGIFPYVMIIATLIFFEPKFHQKILNYLRQILRLKQVKNLKQYPNNIKSSLDKYITKPVLVLFFVFHILFPWRYLLYPGELFWTEEGYRFSWRVMLMEKSGYAQFKIVDKQTKRWFYVNNSDFLTPFQEKQMSFQPDFILEYAHFLKEHFYRDGHRNISIYVESYVSLNGRPSQPFIDPSIDLTQEKESFKPKNWILPFNHEIKGL